MIYHFILLLSVALWSAPVTACCRGKVTQESKDQSLLPLYEEREEETYIPNGHPVAIRPPRSKLHTALNLCTLVGTSVLIAGFGYAYYYLDNKLEIVEDKVDMVALSMEHHATNVLNDTDIGLHIFEQCPTQTVAVLRCLGLVE